MKFKGLSTVPFAGKRESFLMNTKMCFLRLSNNHEELFC